MFRSPQQAYPIMIHYTTGARRLYGRIALASILLVFYTASFTSAQQQLTLHLNGIRTAKGEIGVQVFTDEKGFEDSKPVLQVKFPKEGLTDGKMSVTISVTPGVRGIAVLDDENSNNKMDYNLIGIPKEGFGFSEYYHNSMRKPKFSDFKTNITPATKALTVRMRYL